jgi:hypothetical protein
MGIELLQRQTKRAKRGVLSSENRLFCRKILEIDTPPLVFRIPAPRFLN